MSGIRSRNTKPEKMVRSGLHGLGLRFRLHVAALPGRPDLVLPRYRTVVFVHGCFWHGHDCPHFRWPSARSGFWRQKISGNRRRDCETRQELGKDGWRVLVLWECVLRGRRPADVKRALAEAARWLRSGRGKYREFRGP